ncbi:MAG: hypothetical protein J07HB67_02362 [halophilic archaeon J07HB67]|nr:MAG: hypothetical protein J07HB67_02362 [halophilic archaeon J07HB67]
MAEFPALQSFDVDWEHDWLSTYIFLSLMAVTLRWGLEVTGDGGPQTVAAESVWLLGLLPAEFAFLFALQTTLQRLEASDDEWRLYAFVAATLVGYVALWSDLLAHLLW